MLIGWSVVRIHSPAPVYTYFAVILSGAKNFFFKMDFKTVLENLLRQFNESKIRYALIGGFALGFWGVGRATVDLDFLIHCDDMEKVNGFMKELGYECKYKTENVSQYVSPLRVYGEVDFLHAFREASLEMLKRSEEKEVFGSLKIKVLRPEDIIGLKFQAIKNNPSREGWEIEDIESLLSIHGKNLDWSLVEKYSKILDVEELYKKIRRGREK